MTKVDKAAAKRARRAQRNEQAPGAHSDTLTVGVDDALTLEERRVAWRRGWDAYARQEGR